MSDENIDKEHQPENLPQNEDSESEQIFVTDSSGESSISSKETNNTEADNFVPLAPPPQESQKFLPPPPQESQKFLPPPPQESQKFLPPPPQESQKFLPPPPQESQKFLPPPSSHSSDMKFPSAWKKGIALSLGGTLILSSVLAGYFGYVSGFSAGKDAGVEAASKIIESQETLPEPIVIDDSGTSSVADIAAAVSPSVVKIKVLNESGNFEIATGSGVVVDKEGHIVTNAHVAIPDDAEKHTIQAILPDKEVVEAKLVGYSRDYDVAVLKINKKNIPYGTWGDSEKLKVGEMVVALGSPLGLQGTVTSGIVSAVERPVAAGGLENGSFLNAIQTDAAINPGNSGGPLVNTEAKIIGINTAIATLPAPFTVGGEGSIGLGFAIPSNIVKRVAEEIIQNGEALTPAIGIIIDNTYEDSGVKILEVTPESPAQKAGVKPGDIITGINGKRVEESLELVVSIRSNKVGDTINVTIERDGRPQELKMTLAPLKVAIPSTEENSFNDMQEDLELD
jgi:putative serine protease PepD